MSVRRLTAALLVGLLAAYTAAVARDFSRYVNRYPYLSVDDSVANVAYALASHRQYGFFASPTQALTRTDRLHGFPNYGPWYFAFGAALIWVFGYSLALLRSIHFLCMIAIGAASCAWFRRSLLAAGVAVALAVIYAFEAVQWPMVRPDSFVSLFAVAFVVAAGLAIERDRAAWWFAAGVAAGCAVFTHLIAWSLAPASAAVVAVAALARRTRQTLVRSLAALAGGGIAAALMFYAAIGFRVVDHLATLRAYRQFTAGRLAPSSGFLAVLATHLEVVSRFPRPFVLTIGILLAAGLVMLVDAIRRRALADVALLLPPYGIFAAYVGSLGVYTNFHSGYAILTQVMACWCGGAAIAVAARRVSAASPAGGLPAIAADLAVAVVAVVLCRTQVTTVSTKTMQARQWAPIDGYTDRVLAPIPRRAPVWGSVVFGMESPDRAQLVQFREALTLEQRQPAGERREPDAVVFGGTERAESFAAVLDRRPSDLDELAAVLPHARYRTVALVSGDPYGVTRVWRELPDNAARLPDVAHYDAATRRWLTLRAGTTGEHLDLAPAAVKVRLLIEGAMHTREATHALRASLDTGVYALRVALRTGPTGMGRLVTAGPTAQLDATSGEAAPAFDSAPYLPSDAQAWLIVDHRGGDLFVGQFDPDPASRVEAVDAFPLAVPEPPDGSEQRIAADRWEFYRETGIATERRDNGVAVRGNTTQWGFQAASPVLDVPPFTDVWAAMDVRTAGGRVCTGVLDQTQQRFLIAPDAMRRTLGFNTGANRKVRLVLANCNPFADGNVPSDFTLEGARVRVPRQGSYVQRLLEGAR